MRGSKSRNKQSFINLAKESEVKQSEMIKKLGITKNTFHQLVCDMRRDGHEIWIICKSPKDEDTHYKYINGPAIVFPSRDKVVDLLKTGHFSFKEIAEKVFIAESTAKTAIHKLRQQYKIDKQVGQRNVCYYKIVGDL